MLPIQVKNTATGVVFQAVSTGTGNYTVTQLPIGSYELSATVQGFKRYERQNITLVGGASVAPGHPVGNWREHGSRHGQRRVHAAEDGIRRPDAQHHSRSSCRICPMLGVGNANSGSSGIRNPLNVAQ